jgi:uncharacterized membrane protein YphA (DoxX/SURF4 family)
MKTALVICRWIVGILFIFSGLVKANDPLGLSYKMQEFFEVWGWHGWSNYALLFSVLMIAFEIIAGVAVLLALQMPLFSWLLLLLIVFFTFLTGYALFSGKIKTCGCFGDCIPLTADQSFTKDIVLLVLILLLFRYRKSIHSSLNTKKNILLLLLTTIFSFGMQWYVLKHLPLADCLPFKKGNNIQEKMKIPVGAIPDSTIISFVYNKQGKQVEFTSDSFPEDFDDTLYQFVKRYDKLIKKGNAEAPIKDFSLTTRSGTDTTAAILERKGYTLLLFVKELPENNKQVYSAYMQLHTAFRSKKGIPLFIATSLPAQVTRHFNTDKFPIEADVLSCDFVAVKTASRSAQTLYLLNNGSIFNKWAMTDFDKAMSELSKLSNQ